MRSNFISGAEQALAFGVGADGGCRAVEVCGLGVGAEDVGEEEVAYTTLFQGQLGSGEIGRKTYCHDNAY